MYNFVAIEGNIGAGKTELSKLLANTNNAQLIQEEFTDNSYLPKFYENPNRYAFPLEVSFLVERYQQLNAFVSDTDLFQQQIVSDYFFDKSLIFARNNLNNEQYLLLKRLFDIFTFQIMQPDLILYLHRPVDEIIEQIHFRGRPFEQSIQKNYLQNIQDYYFNYFKRLDEKRIVVADVSGKDFKTDSKVLEAIQQILKTDYPKKLNLVSV